MTSTPPSPSEHLIPEKESYDIELTKDGKGLGITVAGYVCEKGTLSNKENQCFFEMWTILLISFIAIYYFNQ